MDSSLLQVSYLSVVIVVLLGLLFILILFWSKAKKSGFQSRKLDETSNIMTYEQLLKQGKLSREEYHKIQNAMLKKHGFVEPQPKPENQKNQKR